MADDRTKFMICAAIALTEIKQQKNQASGKITFFIWSPQQGQF